MPLRAKGPKDRIILGLLNFGPNPNVGARVLKLEEFNECLDYFQAQGYNEVDTARSYGAGTQEGWTAQAGWKKRGLQLATKHYPYNPGEHKPEVVKKALNKSLKELQTDKVDIFYLHAADRSVPFKETLEAVNELYKEGKFARFGLSNFTAFEVAEVCMLCQQYGWIRPTIWQGMYNAIMRNIETELIPACRRYGLDVVVYNPIGGGFFSGKIKLNEIPEEGRFAEDAIMGTWYRDRYFRDANFEALRIIETAAKKHDITLLETAFRWIVHHSQLNIKGGDDGILIGVSSFDQLKENLRNCEKGPLPEDVVAALDQAWLIAKPTSPVYWHMDLKYTYDTQKAIFG